MGKKRFSPVFISVLFRRFNLGTEKRRRLTLVLHSVGLSSLGAALYLQSSVFGDIIFQGYFKGIEQNFAVLSFEVFFDAVAVVYFGYLFWRLVLSAV
jgi:hypothetical protein